MQGILRPGAALRQIDDGAVDAVGGTGRPTADGMAVLTESGPPVRWSLQAMLGVSHLLTGFGLVTYV